MKLIKMNNYLTSSIEVGSISFKRYSDFSAFMAEYMGEKLRQGIYIISIITFLIGNEDSQTLQSLALVHNSLVFHYLEHKKLFHLCTCQTHI